MSINRRKLILGVLSGSALLLSIGITSCVQQQPQASTGTPDLAKDDNAIASSGGDSDSITVYTALEDDFLL